MIAAMPRPRPPRLVREIDRHGNVRWYHREGQGKRMRLPGAYGSPEFMAAYAAAEAGEPPPAGGKHRPGAAPLRTLADLNGRYEASLAFCELSPATRRQRQNVMKRIIAENPDLPFKAIERRHILDGIDRRRERPAAARHFLETLRGLFQWAVEADFATADPTQGVKTPRKASDGHHVWTDEECARFEARWPPGTRERLAYDVLLYTGLRRGDAVTLGRQHIRGDMIELRTGKTGEWMYFPVLPPLVASIEAATAAGVCGDLAFIAGERGQPLTKEGFGNWFRGACNAAEVPGSAHGLRKATANRVALWLTEAQLEALFGWERGSRVTPIYTNKTSRQRLAREAAEKLKDNMLFPHHHAGEGIRAKS